jgi:hypothetical protein
LRYYSLNITGGELTPRGLKTKGDIMRHTTLAFVLGAFVLLGCAAKGNGQTGENPRPKEEGQEGQAKVGEAYKDTTVGEFSLKWRIDTLQMLHVRLSAPTTGWVAVGFAPSKMMADANFIIAYVADGEVKISDEFGTGNTEHKPDTELGGTDDIGEKSGSEKDGVTMIHFAIPLASGDKYDRKLEPGETYKIILAYGPKDDFTSHHKKKTSVRITLN